LLYSFFLEVIALEPLLFLQSSNKYAVDK
jgi:hypothetical protein